MRNFLKSTMVGALATLASAGLAPTFAESGKICGGIAGLPCDKGFFCELKIGECIHSADTQGHCVKRPQICNKIFMPVCGCDKKTYGNGCEARAAGVSKAHAGRCTK